MSDLIKQAGMALSSGQFTEAMELFDKVREAEPDNAVAHYGWAESAFMRLSMDMEEDVPAGKIMQVYKKAMQLDEENLEYVASFANFCLDCGRIPMAIKEYQRLEKMAELNEIPVEDTLFDASRLIVDAIERVGQGRDNPMIQPWLRQALVWAVGGLGYSLKTPLKFYLLTSEVHRMRKAYRLPFRSLWRLFSRQSGSTRCAYCSRNLHAYFQEETESGLKRMPLHSPAEQIQAYM